MLSLGFRIQEVPIHSMILLSYDRTAIRPTKVSWPLLLSQLTAEAYIPITILCIFVEGKVFATT